MFLFRLQRRFPKRSFTRKKSAIIRTNTSVKTFKCVLFKMLFYEVASDTEYQSGVKPQEACTYLVYHYNCRYTFKKKKMWVFSKRKSYFSQNKIYNNNVKFFVKMSFILFSKVYLI